MFGLKAPQRITHWGRPRNVDEPVRFFCDTARTLGAKLGPLLFQLPPNFPKDLGRLADLLALLPRPGLRVRVPPRLLAGRRRLRAAARAQRGPVHRRQRTGDDPLVATADFGYLRLRDEGYDDAGLASWVETIRTRGPAGATRTCSSSTRPRGGSGLRQAIRGPASGLSRFSVGGGA